MKHPTLKIEKVEAAQVTWGDYGASTPEPGDWSYRTPAIYHVTGPTGRTYTVSGTAGSFMQRSRWSYDHGTDYAGGFATRAKCLAAIDKREAALATQ